MSDAMHIWITKYALSDGICDVEAVRTGIGTLQVVDDSKFKGWYIHYGEYELTRKEAVAEAHAMAARKIDSLERQLAKAREWEEKYRSEKEKAQ